MAGSGGGGGGGVRWRVSRGFLGLSSLEELILCLGSLEMNWSGKGEGC